MIILLKFYHAMCTNLQDKTAVYQCSNMQLLQCTCVKYGKPEIANNCIPNALINMAATNTSVSFIDLHIFKNLAADDSIFGLSHVARPFFSFDMGKKGLAYYSYMFCAQN